MSETQEAMSLSERYSRVLERVRSVAGGRKDVVLLAVSKGQPDAAIEELYRLGQRDFGENYVQELLAKAAALQARGIKDIRWHFIGHLQTNKVKQLIPVVYAVHSVDSEKLARELAKRWIASGRAGRLPVFLEVNIDSEPGKSGVAVTEAGFLARNIGEQPELELLGLMCIPEPSEDPEALRARFRQLRELEAGCRPATHGQLSMGMSADFEAAIEEGATHVRVGTALFGKR